MAGIAGERGGEVRDGLADPLPEGGERGVGHVEEPLGLLQASASRVELGLDVGGGAEGEEAEDDEGRGGRDGAPPAEAAPGADGFAAAEAVEVLAERADARVAVALAPYLA
ncbi:MAG TPA: hypothetical protein VD970_00095 [Acetobacteraceae bacterium]|nr:hypothetical protein [Acetobacteraceae bacterium]